MFKEIIALLKEKGLTISAMESCTGGGVSNAITNIEGASDVFEFGAVTYSNEYKIKMGVSSEVIDKYSVYSVEVAREMSRAIADFTNSDYGIGITGKLNRLDKNNLYGKDNKVFISVYNRLNDSYNTVSVEVNKGSRCDNKAQVLEKVKEMLLKELA